jgi:hypothetical protein
MFVQYRLFNFAFDFQFNFLLCDCFVDELSFVIDIDTTDYIYAMNYLVFHLFISIHTKFLFFIITNDFAFDF